MKRILTILLTLTYLASTAGVCVNIHECHGKVTSKKIDLLSHDTCGCKGGMKKDCCKNTVILCKIPDNQQQAGKISAQNFESFSFLGFLQSTFFIFFSQLCSEHTFASHSPPRSSTTPLYISNNIFRI
jgi:hypothetical protein